MSNRRGKWEKRYAGRKRSGTNEKGNKPTARKSTTILMLRPKLCVFTGVVLNTVLVRFMRWKGSSSVRPDCTVRGGCSVVRFSLRWMRGR